MTRAEAKMLLAEARGAISTEGGALASGDGMEYQAAIAAALVVIADVLLEWPGETTRLGH